MRCFILLGFRVWTLVNLAMIAIALHRWGAKEIRGDVTEVWFLTIVGGVWLVIATQLFSWFGLSFREDALERRNMAALVALSGAITAVALAYAGGSVGEGPAYWNNIFSAGLATGGIFLFWILLELGGKVSVSIAEERNFASGLRLGGFLLALGLILGRAVAGDWHSESATILDFIHDGWPAVGLWALALGIERLVRPSRRQPFPPWWSCGLLPALLYLGLAGAWLWHLGAWEGMPK
jgi:uncharacterized membrane protein YjfL (UPF0719 family)